MYNVYTNSLASKHTETNKKFYNSVKNVLNNLFISKMSSEYQRLI